MDEKLRHWLAGRAFEIDDVTHRAGRETLIVNYAVEAGLTSGSLSLSVVVVELRQIWMPR